MSEPVLKLSVGKLIAFSCRSGDLIHTGLAGPTALEGQAAHKILQAKKSASAEAEVRVKTRLSCQGYQVQLSGRIDLVEQLDNMTRLGEIKTTYAPVEKIPASQTALHNAQLKVYGYCYLQNRLDAQALQQNPQIALRLIWYNFKTRNQHTQDTLCSFDDLSRFVIEAVTRYVRWHKLVSRQREQTQTQARSLAFPHGRFRDGQREMAAAIYCAGRDKSRLLLEAPTGIGKTISALFAAVKGLGAGHFERIVYLTAKNSGRLAAAAALEQLQHAGLPLSAITITAKKTTCHCSNGRCERDDDGRCPLTLGFFDRLPAAREELKQLGVITPEQLDQVAGRHQLCPFELIQQMLPWMDAIVCDYNYVFDPLVRFSFFEESGERNLMLIDEAHNLLDRSRSMFSAKLNRAEINHSVALGKTSSPLICKDLQRLSRAIHRWAKNDDAAESANTESPPTLAKAVARCAEGFANAEDNASPLTESLAEIAREIYRYAVIDELFSEHHRTFTTRTGNRQFKRANRANITVRLRCLDAADYLRKRFVAFHSAVVFSATLRPQAFYLQSLGLPDNTSTLALRSPFAVSQQGTFLCSYIDTRYAARDQSVDKIVHVLHTAWCSKAGNYQVFFPSYAYMEQIFSAFQTAHPDVPVTIQQRESSDTQRSEYLARFDDSSRLMSFAIMGGIYAEGVDYVGEKLIGSIIVGTGLPAVSLEQKLIEQHYNAQQLNGFDYASRYPGLTRVLQTAGRVIRSELDTGIVILIDTRFEQAFYKTLFPPHWQVASCRQATDLEHQLADFWRCTE